MPITRPQDRLAAIFVEGIESSLELLIFFAGACLLARPGAAGRRVNRIAAGDDAGCLPSLCGMVVGAIAQLVHRHREQPAAEASSPPQS